MGNLISLNTGWIAGFFDAEGCCYAGTTANPNLYMEFRLRLKASIDQQYEFEILEQICKLFSLPNVTTRNEEKQYYQVELSSKISLALLIS